MKSSTKRFGSRYGARLRKKLGDIEKQQKATYRCPYCEYDKVKRLFIGVWKCDKCEAKFTGKAYTVTKKKKNQISNKQEE